MPGHTITKDFLLSRTKAKSLACIQTLDLSGLEIESLDGGLLSQLTSLKVLDISNNSLSKFPQDAHLPNLRKLDCRENRLNGVTFVKKFPCLEEFYVLGNGLQPADRYIVAALCPALKRFDTNNLLSLNNIVSSVKAVIEPEIEDEWECNYADQLTDGQLDTGSEWSITQSLAASLHSRHKAWSSKMKELLGEFMIDYLAQTYVHEQLNKTPSPRHKKLKVVKLSVNRSPRKCTPSGPKHINVGRLTPSYIKPEITPTSRTPLINNVTKGSSGRLCNSPCDTATVESSLPNRGLKRKRSSIKSKNTSTLQVNMKIGAACPPVGDYDPIHFIRCHFGDAKAKKEGHVSNDPTDSTTDVWACKFEPDSENTDETTNILATCGGENVCLIDVSSGHVLLKYHQANMQYSCLAWTTISCEHDGREWKQNILAVAGKGGKMELIDPTRQECFATFGTDRPNKRMGSQEYCINWLAFSTSEPSWLFAGASDAAIELWSVVTQNDTHDNTLLAKLSAPGIQITDMLWHSPTRHLVAACEGGLYAWKFNESSIPNTKLREPSVTLSLPSSGANGPFIDAITSLDENITACKMVGEGSIIVFSLKTALSQSPKVKQVSIQPLLLLNWAKTSADFVHMEAQNGLLVCGDNLGCIWVYNMQPWVNRPQLPKSDEIIQPSRKLIWPDCSTENQRQQEKMMKDLEGMPQDSDIVMNSASVSSCGTWIASVTSNNVVCIWKAQQH